jgi:hypothetical protein
MSPRRRIAMAVFLSTLAAGAAAAQGDEKLGSVSFPNSCTESVQPYLQRAVALLHSFWLEEADAAFADVLRRDPISAIATWGVATVAVGNPFRAGATPAAASTALAAIGQGRTIGAKTERERGYIEAIAAYYDHFGERAHGVRLRSVAEAFAAPAQKHPDEDDTQIFFALYLTATQSPTDKTLVYALLQLARDRDSLRARGGRFVGETEPRGGLCAGGDPRALCRRARRLAWGGNTWPTGREQVPLYRRDSCLRPRAGRGAQRRSGGRRP